MHPPTNNGGPTSHFYHHFGAMVCVMTSTSVVSEDLLCRGADARKINQGPMSSILYGGEFRRIGESSHAGVISIA
ncbi:hypothetical protein TNCV_1218751 [Trichonephila clavipes]|nr:hypothetical protein TNCV_1218751 [Trichonephila clavipes]